MATLFYTCVRVLSEARRAEASRALVDLLRQRHAGQGLAVRHAESNPWLCVDNLGFVSLKPSQYHQAINAIAGFWKSETFMLGAQTTAGCGVYAHYVEGQLRRFLSAGDGIWLQLAGECEDWERSMLKHEPANPPRPGTETLFDDGKVFELAARLELPLPDTPGFVATKV